MPVRKIQGLSLVVASTPMGVAATQHGGGKHKTAVVAGKEAQAGTHERDQ